MINSAADRSRRLQTHGSQEEMKETARGEGTEGERCQERENKRKV